MTYRHHVVVNIVKETFESKSQSYLKEKERKKKQKRKKKKIEKGNY